MTNNWISYDDVKCPHCGEKYDPEDFAGCFEEDTLVIEYCMRCQMDILVKHRSFYQAQKLPIGICEECKEERPVFKREYTENKVLCQDCERKIEDEKSKKNRHSLDEIQ